MLRDFRKGRALAKNSDAVGRRTPSGNYIVSAIMVESLARALTRLGDANAEADEEWYERFGRGLYL